jgi:hypothetical protein
MSTQNNPFPIMLDAMVVTSEYITKGRLPALYVSREVDEEEEETWQFHCGNGDFAMERMQLVRLDNILRVDDTLVALAQLPAGHCNARESIDAQWKVAALLTISALVEWVRRPCANCGKRAAAVVDDHKLSG